MFAQPIAMRFKELREGLRSGLAVKIDGDDYDVLERLGAEPKAWLEGLAGAADVKFETLGRTSVPRSNRPQWH